MSAKRDQIKGLRSSQKLFLLGVTTFGAMLAFISTPSLVHASDTTATVSTSETTTQDSQNNSEINTTNDNTDKTTQTDSSNNISNVSDSNKNSDIEPYYTTRNASDTDQPKVKNDQQQEPVQATQAKTTQIQATQTTTDQPKVNTVVGNSVEDTQTYKSIQKTNDTMNNSDVGIDQAYFGLAGDTEVDQQLTNLGSDTAAKLNDNGYLIKSGLVNNKKTLVVQGKDATGLFYAINNLNNLIAQKNDLTNVNISESPQMSIRGVIEGFYGQPWSQQARKDLFKFMGNHKMNVYIYSPKDDDYLRMNWKELYPQDQLDQIKDLVDSAKENHVQFVYTLSPGNDITYSSQEDFEKTTAKLDQLKSIGVTQFYIALDDIPLTMTADDAAVFKNHPTTNYPNNPWSALADAQAYYVNKVQQDYIKKNNLPDLWLVPTNYSGSKQDPFKEAQGEALDKNIRIQWTGEGVFSGDITKDSVEQANKTYHSDHIFIWDNFPVNDSDQDRLYLNPLEGRSKQLYQVMDGFTSNPMIQPYASWIGLAGYGDYMWNANSYKPGVTLSKTLHELAGDDPEVNASLQQFVDLNQYWDYATEDDKVHAPILSNFINDFENAKYGTAEYATAKKNLINRMNMIIDAPQVLKNMKTIGFYNDSLPWINAASHWARAMVSSIDILDAINSGKTENVGADFVAMNNQIAQANQKALPDSRTGEPDLVITPSVGDGVFQAFIDKTDAAINNWLGVSALQTASDQIDSTATTDIPQYGDNPAENMNTTDLSTKFWSGRNVQVGDTIEVALKDSQEIQRIDIHQGASDDATTGDMFKEATIFAGNNADGSDKVAIGTVTPAANFQLDLEKPIKAKYIFITATKDSDTWLQIRNISVFGKTGLNISNIQTIDNTSSKALFDGTVKTTYAGKLIDSQTTGTIEQNFAPVSGMKSISVVGQVSGTVYIHNDGNWKEIGRVESNQAITKLPINVDSVDGMKLVVDSNTPEFVVNEFGLSK